MKLQLASGAQSRVSQSQPTPCSSLFLRFDTSLARCRRSERFSTLTSLLACESLVACQMWQRDRKHGSETEKEDVRCRSSSEQTSGRSLRGDATCLASKSVIKKIQHEGARGLLCRVKNAALRPRGLSLPEFQLTGVMPLPRFLACPSSLLGFWPPFHIWTEDWNFTKAFLRARMPVCVTSGMAATRLRIARHCVDDVRRVHTYIVTIQCVVDTFARHLTPSSKWLLPEIGFQPRLGSQSLLSCREGSCNGSSLPKQ